MPGSETAPGPRRSADASTGRRGAAWSRPGCYALAYRSAGARLRSVTPRRPARRLRLPRVPSRPAEDHRRRARRARLHRRDADRRRQVAHLPDPGAHPARHGAGGLAAHLADEGPGRRARRALGFRATVLNSTLDFEERRGGSRALRRGELELVYVAPEGLEGSLRALLAEVPVSPGGGRRGALHHPLGPRLPPRLPAALRAQAGARRHAGAGAHRDRDAARGGRHHPPARHARSPTASRARSSAPTSASRRTRRATGRGTRKDILGIVRRRRGESGIVYCLSRTHVESLADVAARRTACARVPYHAGLADADARAQPGRLRARRGRRGGGDHRLRHGHRQEQRALRDPPRHAEESIEALVPGDRPRRPRRAARATACCCTRGPT